MNNLTILFTLTNELKTVAQSSIKICQFKLMKLKAEAKLDTDFNIIVVHEKILETSCVYLALLEDKLMNSISLNKKS